MQQVVIAVIVVVILFVLLKIRRKYDGFEWVKNDPWWKPVAFSYGQNPKQFMIDANKTHGPLFKMFLGLISPVVVQRPDLYSAIYKNQESSISVRPVGNKLLKGLQLDKISAFDNVHSLAASHEGFNSIKRGHTGKQLQYVSNVLLKDQLNVLLSNNKYNKLHNNNNNTNNNKKHIEINLLSSQLILTTTIRYVFGEEFIKSEKGIPVDEFASLFREFELAGVNPINLMMPYLPFGIPKKVKELKQKIKHGLDAAVRHHWQNPENESEYNGDNIFKCYLALVLRHTVKANDEMEKHKDKGWTKSGIAEVRNHLHWVLLAVHLNTAVTLAWCISHLAHNLKMREAFLNGEISTENLVYETNAHFAISTAIPRTTMQDIHLTNKNENTTNDNNNTNNNNNPVSFPKGTTLFVDQTMTLYSSFPDILEQRNYDPKRWTSEKGRKLIEQQMYLPFGLGPHVCLGKSAAMEYIKTALTELFTENEVSLVGSFPDIDKSKSVGMLWPDNPIIEVSRKSSS